MGDSSGRNGQRTAPRPQPPNAPRASIASLARGRRDWSVAKNFAQRGIAFECLERERDLGGVWYIATGSGVVCEATHLVSPIGSTAFDDLPMLDEDFPEYPCHQRVLGHFA